MTNEAILMEYQATLRMISQGYDSSGGYRVSRKRMKKMAFDALNQADAYRARMEQEALYERLAFLETHYHDTLYVDDAGGVDEDSGLFTTAPKGENE